MAIFLDCRLRLAEVEDCRATQGERYSCRYRWDLGKNVCCWGAIDDKWIASDMSILLYHKLQSFSSVLGVERVARGFESNCTHTTMIL